MVKQKVMPFCCCLHRRNAETTLHLHNGSYTIRDPSLVIKTHETYNVENATIGFRADASNRQVIKGPSGSWVFVSEAEWTRVFGPIVPLFEHADERNPLDTDRPSSFSWMSYGRIFRDCTAARRRTACQN